MPATQNANALDIIEAINDGAIDNDLDLIRDTIKGRKDTLAKVFFANLQEGDRVQVKQGIRPRYLIGAKATVVEKRITKVTVRFDDDIDDPYNKWAGTRCILSPGSIEPVEDEG